MAVDPSIILGVRPVQLDNPIDSASKVMQLQSLGLQNQNIQRQFQADQDLRDAYSQSMIVGPNGVPAVDRQKLMTILGPKQPALAMQENQKLGAQDLAAKDQQIKAYSNQINLGKQILSQVPTDPNTPLEVKQAAWTKQKQDALRFGMPQAENLPNQYPGDSFVNNMKMHLMSAEEQLAQHNKDREFGEKQQEFAQREKDRQLQRDQMGAQKQNQALQQTQSILESARGNPAVAQAQKDLYAAQKFESLVNLYGDPNRLNPQQVQLAASEVGKIATGGVPTSHELQGLNQATLPSGIASLAQAAFNHPQGAEAGAFVKALGDYVSSLKKDAQGVIKEKYGRVIETRRGQLGEQHYNDLKAQYLDPLMDQGKSVAHPQDDAAMAWAKQNPNDPRAAQIMKLNGGGQ